MVFVKMFNIYATLLDGFQDYLDSSEIYQEYWGFSEDPQKSEEEFEKEQFQGLIDRINRVPFDSEAADKGTAFNEVVDCILQNCNSEKMTLSSYKEKNIITAEYNNRTFNFPMQETKDFAKQFDKALCQVYAEKLLFTKYGYVKLYGYIDEVMPLCLHDIKTTSKYKAGKFRKHWQKIVYPYCVSDESMLFEYNIVRFKDTYNNFDTYTESYTFVPERDIKLLTDHVERFIEFLLFNQSLITDKKIFNEVNSI